MAGNTAALRLEQLLIYAAAPAAEVAAAAASTLICLGHPSGLSATVRLEECSPGVDDLARKHLLRCSYRVWVKCGGKIRMVGDVIDITAK